MLRALTLAVGLVLVAACGGGDDDGAGTTTTEVARFEGDADSAVCRATRDAAERPVLDPFEPGLDPREVELRFRALAQRFGTFADLAPEPLADDLALLDERFDRLAAVLQDADYDFEALVGSGEDLSLFDAPELVDVADRLAAYQEQVCNSAPG